MDFSYLFNCSEEEYQKLQNENRKDTIKLSFFSTQGNPEYVNFEEVLGFMIREKNNLTNTATRTKEIKELNISENTISIFKEKFKMKYEIQINNNQIREICKDVDLFQARNSYLENINFYKFVFPRGEKNLEEKPQGKIKKLAKFFSKYFSINKFLEEAQDSNPVFQFVGDIVEMELIERKIIKENINEENEMQNIIQVFPEISELFKSDAEILNRNKRYFREKIEVLLHYYSFFYLTQLIMPLNNGEEKIGYNKIKKICFILEWEEAKKWRESYNSRYKHILEEQQKRIFLYEFILKQIYKEKEEKYDEVLEEFKEIKIGKEELEKLKEVLSEKIYKKDSYNTYLSKFAVELENITKRFTQNRGQLGKIFVIDSDLLLLLTNIIAAKESINKEKLLLKNYFKKLEERGIYFDEDSRNAVEEFLVKSNLIEKSSDSGDVKYVKSIL